MRARGHMLDVLLQTDRISNFDEIGLALLAQPAVGGTRRHVGRESGGAARRW